MRRKGCGCLKSVIIITLVVIGIVWLFTHKDQVFVYFFPRDYEQTIDAYCDQYNVDKWLVLALIREESGFDADAVSAADARGLMQLMPDTAAWLIAKGGLDMDAAVDLKVPEYNIQLGVYYISVLFANYADSEGRTDPATVIAAYNAGMGSVSEWLADGIWDGSTENLEDIPYGETARHVKKVLRSYKIYQYLYNNE